MKKSIVYLGILSVALIFTSCGGDEAKTEEAAQQQACFYKYNSGSTVLEWTAFKFTEKAPVKGTFNEITYEGKESSDDLEDLVKSMSFSIQTASVETQNEERNGKIAKLFFETIGTPVIKAKVLKLENGKASVGLQEIDSTHDFYNLEGSDNIILFYTNRYKEQPLIIKGAGAGAEVTAAGIFGDIIRIGKR